MSQADAPQRPLNCDRDAERWAREFNEVIVKNGSQPFDPGFLIGWFANAMMCGEDTYRWRKEAAQSATAPTGQRAVAEKCAEIAERYFDEVDKRGAQHETAESIRNLILAYAATLPQQPAVPEGYKLIPVAILKALLRGDQDGMDWVRIVNGVTLAAAPKQDGK